ncbi:MAG: carbohydrate porin [Candidatus Brocadiia bacterium]
MDRRLMGKIRHRPAAMSGAAAVVSFLSLMPLPAALAGSAGSPDNAPPVSDTAAQPEAAPGASAFDNNLTGGWWGERQRLQDAGITLGATLTLEGFNNFRGGLATAPPVAAATSDLNLALDTGKLLGWRGGEFYADLEDHAGRNPTTALVGDLQVFDKQNSSPYLQVFEIWYQQKLWDDKVRVKIGKVDANTEFSVIENGLPFLGSSTQVSPTIFVFPTTPDPMPSANVFFTPAEFWYADFGAYYANRSDRFGDLSEDPAGVQRTEGGTFLIGETGLKWSAAPLLEKDGNLKLGVWEHTGTFTRLDGSKQQGTYGGYAILDQTLWQPKGEPRTGRGVRTFLEYGATQDDINAIDRHFGGGVTWTGPIAARAGDVIGLSPQYAHISSQAGLAHPYELAVETFYQWQLTAWAFVQPDIQYIVHPGGAYPNALVGTLRVQITF